MKQVQRSFFPGDKWVYFKIYTGVKTADKILFKDILAIVKKIREKELIDKWFFIRYSDPDFHLRIRLLVKDLSYTGEIINIFYQQVRYLTTSNEIWKIQLDTYNRELERYGNNLIEEAESVFSIDSDCILSILKSLDMFRNENYRWMIALRMIDKFLLDFSLSLEERQELLKNMSNSFKTEFGFNMYNSKQFNSKFRENKKTIESVLNENMDDPHFNTLALPLKKRSKRLIPLVPSIKGKTKFSKIDKDKKQLLSGNMHSLLSSYIHMSVNRLFRSKSRLHELIIYDFMYRYYTSEIAKKNNTVKK